MKKLFAILVLIPLVGAGCATGTGNGNLSASHQIIPPEHLVGAWRGSVDLMGIRWRDSPERVLLIKSVHRTETGWAIQGMYGGEGLSTVPMKLEEVGDGVYRVELMTLANSTVVLYPLSPNYLEGTLSTSSGGIPYTYRIYFTKVK